MNPEPNNQTLLIVDDTPRNLVLAVEAMEASGYRVAVAQDGEEALRRARLVRPDLILLDIMLPGENGFEICRRLKSEPETHHIPVIFMTALATTEHKVKGFAVGGVDYVTKPLQLDEVSARVATHLELVAARRDLELRNAQLEAYRLELEQRVDERTAELSASNRQLRAEIDLRRAAEERLALIGFALDRVHEAAYLVDETGRIHYVNEAACRRLGYTQDELLGLNLSDFDADWPIEREPQAWAAHWSVLCEQGGLTFETRHRTRDGEIFPVEVSADHFEYGDRAYVLGLARDISERKRAERELRLLKRALDNAFDATYLLGTDLRFRYVNEAATRVLGYSREELSSVSLLDIDPDVTPEAIAELMRQTAADGRFPGTIESRHRRKDGSTFPIEVGATTFEDEGETLFLTVVRDISERKQAEEALRGSEQRYREIFENAVEGMYLLEVTEEGRFRNIDINPALAASTGIPREAMIGRYVDDAVPEEVGRQVVEKYRRCVAAGATLTEGIELDLPAGKRHYISTITPIRFQGRIHRLIGISRDITERKRMEEALADREREYRTLVENLPDNLIRYNGSCQAVYCNPNCVRVLPQPVDGVLGKTPCEAFPGVDGIVVYQAALQRVVASGRPERIEAEVPGPDGDMQIHQISFVAERRSDGEIRGALAIGRDVTALVETERRLAESHARLRELLARREADRDDERRCIAREMHDELGQVLTALKLGISTLRMQFGHGHPTLEAKVLGLLELADRAIRTVRAVATSLRPAALDMGIFPALQWLVDEFERHSGVTCRLNVPDALCEADEVRAMVVFRAVQEALTNAARHADAHRVEIDLKCAPDGACLLEIRDDGRGFDPASTAGHFGLVGMRERIDSVGGTLLIDSAPGAGTCIRIRIPDPDGAEACAP